MNPESIAARAADTQALWRRIPQELRSRDQWCVAGANKSPKQINGGDASSTNPSTWTTYERAAAHAAAHGMFVGFVLTADDPFCVIDLDWCNAESQARKGQDIDKKKWSTPADAERFLQTVEMLGSYTEISTYGNGLHIFVRASISEGLKRPDTEVYSQGRFIICTGNTLAQTNAIIEDRNDIVNAMVTKLRPKQSTQVYVDQPATETDAEIVERASRAVNGAKFLGLWRGDFKNYSSVSESDLALMNLIAFLSPNNEQCKRIFRDSALGKREKITKHKTYLDRTLAIVRATDKRREHIEHGRQIVTRLFASAYLKLASPRPSAAHEGFTLGYAKPGEQEVQTEYIHDPWLPRGSLIGHYGRGEAGKSSFTAQECAAASHGAKVSTLWITSEERPSHIRKRHLACGGEPNTLAVVEAIPVKLDPISKKATATTFNVYEHLEPAIQAFLKNPETRADRPLAIVVLDAIVALTTWGKGETPNDDAAVKRLCARLREISEQYNTTIIILGHLNKGIHKDNIADAVTGAAAWTNSPRLSFMFVKDLESTDFEGFVRTAKTNTGTPFGATYRTVPVHTLRLRPDGHPDVLCGVQFVTEIVWGDMALREMTSGEQGDDVVTRVEQKRQRITTLIEVVLNQIKACGRTNRKAVEAAIPNERFQSRHWKKAEQELAKSHGVQVNSGGHNIYIYTMKAA